MSLIKKLAGETMIYGLGSILPRVLNFIIVTPYFTRILRESKGDYATHGSMYALAGFLVILLTYRMETAFFRFGSKDGGLERTFSTASIAIIGTTTLGFLFLFLNASFVAGLVTKPEDALYVRLISTFVIFDVLSALPFARLRLTNRPLRFSYLKLINVGVTIIALFFLLEGLPFLESQGIEWADRWYDKSYQLYFIFLSNVIASGVILVCLLPEYKTIKWQFDSVLFKKMLIYAAPLIVVGLAGMVNQVLDRILVQKQISDDLAGVYNACIKIAVLMQLFITAFNYAAEPFFFKQADSKDSKQTYALVGQVFTMVASTVFLGIMLYIDIAQLIIDASFRGGLNIVPIMLLAYLFNGLYYNFSIWFKVTDRTIYGAYIATGGAVFTIGLNVLLVPKIGYVGAAWAAFACFGFMATTSYLIGRKYYPIPYPIGRMIGYIVFAILIYGVSHFVRPILPNLILILMVNTILLLIYLGVLYQLEKKTIHAILKG